jgi:hypothetical protein
VGLDLLVRQLERSDEVRWGFPNEREDVRIDRVRTAVQRAGAAPGS